jgi:hypothetical protein
LRAWLSVRHIATFVALTDLKFKPLFCSQCSAVSKKVFFDPKKYQAAFRHGPRFGQNILNASPANVAAVTGLKNSMPIRLIDKYGIFIKIVEWNFQTHGRSQSNSCFLSS